MPKFFKQFFAARKLNRTMKANRKIALQALQGLMIFQRKMDYLNWSRERQKLFWRRFHKEPDYRMEEVKRLMGEVKQ